MTKLQTPQEQAYGPPPGIADILAAWNDDLVDNLLLALWEAYDVMVASFLKRIDWTKDLVNVERSISQNYARVICRCLDGLLPVDAQHGSFEEESRSQTKLNAQPPQYDIAFVWNDDPRLMWPLEAKVITSDLTTGIDLDDYAETINKKLLTGYYAPFSNGAAMVGYLKAGDPEIVISHIAPRLGCTLAQKPAFPDRCHKTSDHWRTIPEGKNYPVAFRCHHLILPLSTNHS